METLAVVGVIGMIGYLLSDEIRSVVPRGRLCDHMVTGDVFTSVPVVLARGNRLLEVHLYSDEDDHPVVARHPLTGGYDYAYDNIPFDTICAELTGAFPSNDPFILSVVPHTDKTIVWNRVAETLIKHLNAHIVRGTEEAARLPMETLKNKLLVVSGGGSIRGTHFESLLTLSWDTDSLRRLGFSQAVHPRDYEELVAYNKHNLTIVAPDPAFGSTETNPETVRAYGCQWVLGMSGPPGFVKKHVASI